MWIKTLDIVGGWGLLGRDAEISVKPLARAQRENLVVLRACNGEINFICNETPDDSFIACKRENKLVLGLSINGDVKEGHIKSSLLDEFSKYKVKQILQMKENVKCIINIFNLEVRTSNFQIEVEGERNKFEKIIRENRKIVLFNGMEFKSHSVIFKIKAMNPTLNYQEWLPFIIVDNSNSQILNEFTFKEDVQPVKIYKQLIETQSLMSSIKKLISEEITMYFTNGLPDNCILIKGASGVGKSSYCKILSKCLSQNYIATVSIRCRGLVKKDMAFFQQITDSIIRALEKSPSVVIIEDLEEICGKIEETGLDVSVEQKLLFSRTAIFIISFLERFKSQKKIKFIFTCTNENLLHSLLTTSTHISTSITIPSLSFQDIMQILNFLIPNIQGIGEIASKMKSFQIGDIFLFCESAKLKLKALDVDCSKESILNELEDFIPQALETAPIMKEVTKWDDVGGMYRPKQILLETLQQPIKFALLYQNYELKQQTGILLYGPPGCGKTYLASSIPSIVDLSFISVKGPELLNKYIGASEQSVREVFERAKRVAPCILFFDEFESIAPKRGSGSQTGVTDRVVNQFLCELDGVESKEGVYVIAASSRPEMIDAALLRPGRLDFKIYCGFPNLEERADILETMLKRLGYHLDVSGVAQIADGFTGADIQSVINNLQIKLAHREIESIEIDNLHHEVCNFQRSFNEQKKRKYEAQYSKFGAGKIEAVGEKLALF